MTNVVQHIDSAELSPAMPYRWVILGLCVCCFLFTFITRFTWPPLIPVVVPVLGISMSQAGAYMSAFYMGYIVTQIPAGVLSDRFGVRVILGVSLILEGISTSSMGFMNSYETGFILRVIAGLGAGAVYASCSLALMEWFPPNERGRAFGVFLAAPSGGILMTNLFVPSLNALVGWQGAFKSVGFLTLTAGILVLLLMRSSGLIKSQEKTLLGGFKVIARSRGLILTALSGFCLMWLELGTATWANAHIKKLGFSVAEAGYVMMSYGVGGIIAPLLSGFVSDWTGQRKWLVVGAYLVSAPLCVVFGYQDTLGLLSVTGFILGFTSYIANPQLTVLISQFAGREWAATANGTSNFVFQFASMIGPFILGWSIDVTQSFSIVWWMMAAGPLVGILLMLPVRQDEAMRIA
ncbi:MFS transporter [Desulfomonile tiedjei]|uniref:Sugar phosphate permease n=1 Tax=Desulfomonile tiedjei (strain ATCC 49306 / DSM 6799 / DCB-1) TaxID=706587 RepID=I4C2B1_DESTA|nr:MFS transporter [Desulfomonile tiedjei]AFM23702.1 sugar phosphate permease [Desulfomonile tiedjei DSM 6799]